MAELSGFPYFEVQFDKQGAIHDPAEVHRLLDFVASGSATDLLVISHGWNNDMKEARNLYKDFFAAVREVLDGGIALDGGRRFAVLGILWPSKKFADTELKPSGAASGRSAVPAGFLKKELDKLKTGVFDNPKADKIIDQAKALVDKLEDSPKARAKFADLIRSLPGQKRPHREDAADRFFKLDGEEVMRRLANPLIVRPAPKPGAGGAAAMGAGAAVRGGAAGIGEFFNGFVSAARNLLNFTTYYQMKERAGIVGQGGGNEVLRKIRARVPALKLHLIGHSFGGRLVTAAALGPGGKPPVKFESMTLLQAAFSHNAFGQKYDEKNDGFFRKVVSEGRVTGPVLITCTSNDKAVGIAYPVASLVSGDTASALGDKNDPYGGIGRNGALVRFTPEASDLTLGEVGFAYSFEPGRLYNLNADKVIGDHSDICKKEVAYAMLTAIAKS